MAQRDLKSHLKVVNAGVLTLSGTTPAASTWIDTRESDAVMLMPAVGAVTDAGTVDGFSFELQHSDTTAAADATAVDDLEIIGTEAALTVTSDSADNSIPQTIGYLGSKRYVRLVATGTTGTNASVTVIGVLSNLSRSVDAGPAASVAAT